MRTKDNANSVFEYSLINIRLSKPWDDSTPPTVPMNSPRNIRTMEPLFERVRRGLYLTEKHIYAVLVDEMISVVEQTYNI